MSREPAEEWVPLETSVPLEVLRGEIEAWAQRIGVEPVSIRVREMKRKWASCSSRGTLTFNAELMAQPAVFRAEAIVHELLHLKLPNHGKLFKALMKSYLNGQPGVARSRVVRLEEGHGE